MRVHLHTLCWNERPMLDFFFRHYDPWVNHYFIYDDSSTDGTREYLERRANVTVDTLVRSDPSSWVLSAKYIYDTSWRRSIGKADWVVVANIDEQLFHPHMSTYLEDCRSKGVTVVPALGFGMITGEFPHPESVLWRDYPEGVPEFPMTKMQIFCPQEITETNFTPGRHRAKMRGNVRLPDHDEVLNLHYKRMGIDYLEARQIALASGLREKDLEKNWGRHYRRTSEERREKFDKMYGQRVNVLDPAANHGETYPMRPWWRAKEPDSSVP